MKMNERNSLGSARGVRMMGMMLVIFSLCCMAMVPAVAADNKWIGCSTVIANTSFYGTINGVDFTNQYFFGVVGNSHFNTTAPAWNWTQGASPYTDRYYMEQLKIGDTWYPNDTWNRGGSWQWEFVSDLTPTATIYKKGLGGYVNNASGTYYAWWGNKTAAYITYNNHTNWLVPSYENATFIVNLTETWDDE